MHRQTYVNLAWYFCFSFWGFSLVFKNLLPKSIFLDLTYFHVPNLIKLTNLYPYFLFLVCLCVFGWLQSCNYVRVRVHYYHSKSIKIFKVQEARLPRWYLTRILEYYILLLKKIFMIIHINYISRRDCYHSYYKSTEEEVDMNIIVMKIWSH